jgi:hypothetical protein
MKDLLSSRFIFSRLPSSEVVLGRSCGFRGFGFGGDGIDVVESLLNREGVHLATKAFARLEGLLQIMAGDFDGERIGDHLASLILVFDPGGMRQRDPDGAAVDQEFYVDGIGVAGGDGDDQRLINAVHILVGPAVGGVEVLIHG